MLKKIYIGLIMLLDHATIRLKASFILPQCNSFLKVNHKSGIQWVEILINKIEFFFGDLEGCLH